jgi:hypothetical protein
VPGPSQGFGFLYRRGSLTYTNQRKTDNRAHSPNTAPQTGTAMPISSLLAAGRFAQTTLARRAGPLSFISARSKKRARIKSSPARITSPTRKVPQPGPCKGANKRFATAIPPTIKRTFRRAKLPWPLHRWRGSGLGIGDPACSPGSAAKRLSFLRSCHSALSLTRHIKQREPIRLAPAVRETATSHVPSVSKSTSSSAVLIQIPRTSHTGSSVSEKASPLGN